MGLCSSTKSLLQRLQSMKTLAVPRASLFALPVPFFFAIRQLFPAQGTFFSCQMGSWIQPFVCSCPLPPACFSSWETSQPISGFRGRADLWHPPWGKSHFQGGNSLLRGNISTSLGITVPSMAVHPHHNQPNKPRVPARRADISVQQERVKGLLAFL